MYDIMYRIDSGIRDTSVSAIALVFSFFQYARPLLFWAFHIMIGQLLKNTKKTGAIPQNGSVSYTRVNTVFTVSLFSIKAARISN
jgi:hypothetical protein